MLSATLATIITSGFFTRPTQADFLDPVTKTVGCLLNLTDCAEPAPGGSGGQSGGGSTPGQTPDPGNGNSGTTEPVTTPPSDTTPPSAALSASPTLAGGSSQQVTISGTLSDNENLASYSIAINGTVAQTASGLTGKTAAVNYIWNVATPNVVESGTYTITLHVTDQAGNSADATPVTVEVDNTPPTVAVSGGGVIIKDGSINPTVSASDAHGVASYAWSEDASNPASLDFDHSAAEPTFTPSIEGSYTFYLSVTDGLGNVTPESFTFGYAKELATVPLPTTNDPTATLIDQSPSTVAAVPLPINPTTRSGRDETTTSDDPNAGVLGDTTTASGQAPTKTTVATIAPTPGGWSVFGLLWYWWLVIIGALAGMWIYLKKFVRTRLPEQS